MTPELFPSPYPRIFPLGESAVLVELGDRIDPDIHHQVLSLAAELEARSFPGLIEVVPAFNTLAVYYDPYTVSCPEQAVLPAGQNVLSPYLAVCEWVREAAARTESHEAEPLVHRRVVTIPVCYGEEYGPDLEYVAILNGLTPEDVIAIHSGRDYRVYMIGFAPGFPYLGGMSERIAAPRLSAPRSVIPAGSVGIAGTQTGIYPLPTPGGWRLIGRSPLVLFNPEESPPTRLQAGDTVRFQPITASEYKQWERRRS